MSAIFGIFHKEGLLNKSETENMRNSFTHVNFDDEGKWLSRNVFFGCLHQQLTPESELEKIPYVTFKSNVIINADVILYNRKELIDKLELKTEQDSLTDVFLLSAAYHRWGYSCPEYLNGDFSFVIFDKKLQKLFCCRSHTGTRTFYYYDSNNIYAFSSLIKPILKLKGVNQKLNDIYIADYIAYSGVDHEFDPGSTIYGEVKQLPPASCLLVGSDSFKIWNYWKVEKKREIYFKSDAEYEEAFRDILNKAVVTRMRSNKRTGILLSGGFDSGAVAVFASNYLNSKRKRLYAYTQVPKYDSRQYISENRIGDESFLVKTYQEKFDNFVLNFFDSEEKNPYSEIHETIKIYEQPYKMYKNIYWINYSFNLAEHDNVKVLLMGQFGNYTISWGNFEMYLIHLLKKFKFWQVFSEIYQYKKVHSAQKDKMFLHTVLNTLPLALKKNIYKAFKKKNKIIFTPKRVCSLKEKDVN